MQENYGNRMTLPGGHKDREKEREKERQRQTDRQIHTHTHRVMDQDNVTE